MDTLRHKLRDYLDGAAALFDFTGAITMQRSREILERSDAEALRSDWESVGRDLWLAQSEVKLTDEERREAYRRH